MIKSFFKINDFNTVLKICLGTEKDADNFLQFIKIIGNEVVLLKLTTQDEKELAEVKRILENIVTSAKSSDEIKAFITKAFEQIIVKDSVTGLIDAAKIMPKDVQTHFKSETVAQKTLNPYILVELLEMIMVNTPSVIFDAESKNFKQMLTVILLNAMVYRDDKKLLKKLYSIFLKIVIHIVQNFEFMNENVLKDILQLKILAEMIDKTNYDYGSTQIQQIKVSDEQKIILEIIFQLNILNLQAKKKGVESIYQVEETILELENCKRIMFEGGQFDMITYLIYLKELDESQKKTSIIVESNHNNFNGQFTGQISYETFKAFKIKLSDSTEIEKYASVAFSSDSAGKNIICNKYKKDFTSEEEIYSNSVYVHYPFRQPKLLAFGEQTNSKLGLNKTDGQTDEPTIVEDMHDPIVEICSVEHYSVFLDESGKLWKCGQKDTMSGQDNQF